MVSIFDGMAGILSDVLGGEIHYFPQDGAGREIRSIFRETPIEIEGADGQLVRIEAPTWRVRRDLVPELARDDRITLEDGRTFRVMVVHHGGSPASDGFMICELASFAARTV
ncbi:hypothetical protein RGQ15_07130 [Paracoccus sp. MBLB3053]|uniref:Head-tail adaptor protein n=1 Tax=Paracoccus aurantius TaxID=3073814 RepID=A0ABU2HQN1_9RHOB|nr:hypothetical protein [Paracoccus sp. MBLB3053]MDS9467346.1 hypothetical protein [Paracoccus sp. MBLB3053]